MPGKWPDQTLNQAFGLPDVLSTSRLSCKRAGKTRTLMPVWVSSGQSRLIKWLQIAASNKRSSPDQICGKDLASEAPLVYLFTEPDIYDLSSRAITNSC